MKSVSVIVLALFASAAVIAQTGMRPGQWEMTMQMQMPNMPPSAAGFQVPPQKVCITAEQAKDPATAIRQPGRGGGAQDDCKVSDYKMTGNTATFSIACSSPQKTTGTAEITFGNDTFAQTMKMVTAQGEMTMKTTAKRLGDCPK